MIYQGLTCSTCSSPLTLNRGMLECHSCDAVYHLMANADMPMPSRTRQPAMHKRETLTHAAAHEPSGEETWCAKYMQAAAGGYAPFYPEG
jgi:hypothetical protein